MDKKEFEELAKETLRKSNIQMGQLKELTKPIVPENSLGRISRMDAINNKSVNEAALRTLEAKIISVERALKRLYESDFGICQKCKCQIPEGRLLLMPGSCFCVNCA